jgi:ribose transport system permease protein
VTWVLLHQTIYGRYLFAVGRNEEATRYSGVNTDRVVLFAYVISSFLAGISAILLAFYSNAIAPSSHGSFYELYAIAAAVLGGCSLRGGEGTIIGIIIGAALLQVLQNLVNLLGIPSSLNTSVMGGVILISVIIDMVMKQRK